MADDLDQYLKSLPDKVQKQLSSELERIANGLADDIRAAAPHGDTGRLRSSVRAVKGNNDLEFFVEAGGDLTTKEVRSGSGTQTDYALHVEFGTVNMPAKPFFYSTARAKAAAIRDDIQEAIADAISKA